MEKYFATYNQALALKELGFNESCFATFDSDKWFDIQDFGQNYDTFPSHIIAAPLKSQVFEWFREKYNLVFNFISYNIVKPAEYYWSITWGDEAKASGKVKTYEEAESACIDKLIELLQNDK